VAKNVGIIFIVLFDFIFKVFVWQNIAITINCFVLLFVIYIQLEEIQDSYYLLLLS